MINDNSRIPARSEVRTEDTWDLSGLYPDDGEWDKDLGQFEKLAARLPGFRGSLGRSAESLADYLDLVRETGLLEERLGSYCSLRQAEDGGDNAARAMNGRFVIASAAAHAASSWDAPEIQAIPDEVMAAFLEHPRLGEYRIYLKKLLRYRPYILSDKEERIIALHAEGEAVASETFSALTNVDFDFGDLDTPEGRRPLSQSTWAVFMESRDRDFRCRAWRQFYRRFDDHKTALAALYAGSVKNDVIRARVRGYPSALAEALFPDDVPQGVYDNLVSTVNANLVPLHRYYALRKRALRVEELRHYDVYVPLAVSVSKRTGWNEAVDLIAEALAPLGGEYVDTLRSGLLRRWADRYENKGKRSGAFSAGGYAGDPYILMNYKEDSIRDVFTLAHEGGHSMHSWYSARSNPFMHYGYTIFEAEVASTFNEELLFRYLRDHADTKELKLYLANKRADDILATLYRQTMFAEFEKRTHELEESGAPLTVDTLRGEYRQLLVKYFGSEMVFEEESDLEGLRIPHFYRAFYVYKYATGISAALALAERVLSGGVQEREDYFGFLKSGGSRFPMESLKAAGVDMSTAAPVEDACRAFGKIVEELEGLLDP
ncbi:MAG: oligoendopeptidase F [Treponema sp.]|jgi:oligoendopeptidase F|nr:oligoendopeptidase F [Treponema sp.]